jgi:hypothetical protein
MICGQAGQLCTVEVYILEEVGICSQEDKEITSKKVSNNGWCYEGNKAR